MNTPTALRLYRSRHVILRKFVPGHGAVLPKDICEVDGIRILRRKSGARPLLWRHDPDEIRRLVAIEHGATEVSHGRT